MDALSRNGAMAARAQRRAWMAVFMGRIADSFRFAERSAGPVLDLVIRLWLAGIFFGSAVIKISDWEKALFLSANEYPVSWMDPVTAAYLGVSIELAGAVLFALGLATRLAALAMLVLSLVIQLNYVVLDINLFWIALFAWYVVRGAQTLSLDHALARGLGAAALPFAASALRTTKWLSDRLGGPYQLMLRLALAAAVAFAAWPIASDVLAELLPARSAVSFAGPVALAAAALVAVGLGARFAALALAILVLAARMSGTADAVYPYWLASLALIALHGPGALALDALIERRLRRLFPQLEGKPAFSLEGLPRVVIVGAGFGGLTCAAALRRTPAQITLIDRQNYHLFQPLLYQVATAGLSPGDVASPVRGLFRDQFNARVLLGDVTGVDTTRQEVLIAAQRVPYDYLVLATGARHNYFGRDEWEVFAPGLKRIEDATEVRARLLTAFERAEATDDAAQREALLTFVIVGGGPTGVELAGAIAELARQGMEKEFRHFDPASAQVLLIQAGPRLLPTFPEGLSAIAKRSLEDLGVRVLTDSRVEHIDDQGVRVNGARIASRTVLWAAGVIASPAAAWVGAEADRAGRVKVGADLSIPGLPNVFAIGDTALANAWSGQAVPGLAPAAKQGGHYVAKLIHARITGAGVPPAFVYHHLGSLATIGRKSAVVDFGALRLSGTLAWWLWGLIHVGFLVGLRNRVSVMLDWLWAYLTYRSGVRLITGGESAAAPNARAPAPAPIAVGQVSVG